MFYLLTVKYIENKSVLYIQKFYSKTYYFYFSFLMNLFIKIGNIFEYNKIKKLG